MAFRGKELASVATNIISETLLPDPGRIKVVGIAGDELPVHNTAGAALLPYTLWGEIAYQIGGEPLYREVEADATSFAAPGKDYFDKVLGGKMVLIMFDELAQYAARLQASRPDGAEMLAAFLMGLHGYARTHSGISVILTLASHADAFAKETEKLKRLISQVRGQEVEDDQVWDLAQRAEKDLRSVVARDASTIVPIQSFEISRILAKRLFLDIDTATAEEAADAYMKMYAMHTSELPDRASQADFREIMAAHYPLHPTLIRFLNEKMATLETFQGTRGVLRILALVTRSLWSKKIDVPMIHTCRHLDLTDSRIVNEILGRTGGRGGQFTDTKNWRLTGADRDDIKRRFLRGEIDVLVCTDAAAEGLNLQTADLLINFDLPWNPMKVEQRIGRIDRIGQAHEKIYVLNLCYVGSAEEIVYGRLLRRLADVGAIVRRNSRNWRTIN